MVGKYGREFRVLLKSETVYARQIIIILRAIGASVSTSVSLK